MTYAINIEMQSDHRQSSPGSSRRHRSKEHKKSEKHVYYLFQNACEKKPWARAERFNVSISGEQLEKELARSREVGKDAETVMSMLPPTQLKHITKLQSEFNENEESSRYEWRVASVWQEKPITGIVSPRMWCILKREKKEKAEKRERKEKSEKSEKREKKERTDKSSRSSRSESITNDLSALEQHEKLQRFFAQKYVPSYTPYYQPSYVQPGGSSPSYYCPAQPAIQEVTITPSIGGICYESSDSSMDSTDTESHSSGYCSDADSVNSNLTTASTVSSGSNSSIVTPPPTKVLRGILKTKQPSCEVVIHSGAASDSSEQDSRVVCYSGIIKNPSAHSYIGTAPHAMKDFTESREKGYLAEYQLDTASSTASSTTTRKTRFSDEASFCIAYDYYESAEESEGDIYYREREERRRSRRRMAEPGALAISKYVQYGSD